MGVRLRSSQLNGMLPEQASPLTFTIQWEPNGDRRSVTVPGTWTIGYLAIHIVRNKLFAEDEPPAGRRGVLFRGVTMLDEKATLENVHAVLKDIPESERILSWIFPSEPIAADNPS